jgi:uncharacterized protein
MEILIKRRRITADRKPAEDRAEILAVEQLGPNMSKLPNGSLLCKNVPIARTGWMFYGPDETPVEVGADGIARVHRGEDALFAPECMGSFMGAAVVDEHPEDDVTPANWAALSRGFATTDVRRGEGELADCLVADLIVTEAGLIKSILDGKREVSCGYEADYETTGTGEGKQTNIIGNHIALVEKGRCGPRCAIGDRAHHHHQHQPPLKEKETTMATKHIVVRDTTKRRAVLDARKKFQDAEAELEAAELEAGGNTTQPDDGSTHIHIHANTDPMGAGTKDEPQDGDGEDPTETRFKTIEAGMTKMSDSIAALSEAVGKMAAPAKAADEAQDDDEEDTKTADADPNEPPADKSKTMDSAALEAGYKQVLAQAEILVPGFRMPTFDAKAQRKATVDALCASRRKVLDLAYATGSGKELVDGVAGRDVGAELAGMSCAAVTTLFNAAAGAKKLLNNRTATGDGRQSSQLQSKNPTGPRTIAELNELHAKHYASQAKH